MITNSNPILEVQEIKNSIFDRLLKPRPTPNPGEALVLQSDGQPFVIIREGEQMTIGEAVWGKYRKFYRISLAKMAFSFHYDFPSKTVPFKFHGDIEIVCRVVDPIRVVREDIRDVTLILKNEIQKIMRREGRNYDIENDKEVEIAIEEGIRNHILDNGLAIEFVDARIERDPESLKFAGNVVGAKRESDLVKVQMKGQIEQADLEQTLSNKRLDHALSQEKTRFSHYHVLLQDDHLSPSLLLLISRDLNSLAGVIENVQDQQRFKLDVQIKAVQAFLNNPEIDASDLGPVRNALSQLVNSIGDTLGSSTSLTNPRLGTEEPQSDLRDEEEVESVSRSTEAHQDE
jgi:hypothetical protein